MKVTRRNNKFGHLTLLGLILLLAVPAVTFAQGRGRGRGQDKKAEKFINGHDARDGRWDGRGPNRTSRGGIDDIYRNRGIYRDRDIYGRNRRVDRDGDGDFDRNDVILGRNRRVDRDGDGDFDRNDVILGRNRRVDRDGDGDFDRNDVRIQRQERERWERRDRRFSLNP